MARWRRWIPWMIGALVLVWSAAVAVLLLFGLAAAQRGEDALDRAQRVRTYEALIDPGTGERLGAAQDHFARGHSLLSSPVLFPARYLPIIGRQLRAADRLTTNAAEATGIARDAVAEMREISEVPTPQGEERLALLRRLGKVVDDSHRRLEAIDIGEGDALIGPVDDVRTTFVDKRAEAVDGLERASAVLVSLEGLLEGRTYLVFGANNAEMRAGSGMFLSVTTLTTDRGRISMGDVTPTNRLVLDDGVEVPGELAHNWPWLDPGADFRNLALSPQFAQSAEIASRMWPQVPGGGEIDGVMAVDAHGLAKVMRVVGRVTVDGTVYRPSTVREQLLNGQYKQFPNDQAERTDQLGEVARAVFDELETGDWEVGNLASALIEAVGGRHLLLWSADPREQAGWEAASADGALQEDSLAVSVLNQGANKLDYFLDVSADISTVAAGDGTDVRVDIGLRNRTPDRQPKYVTGPNTDGVAASEYTGTVLVNVPRGAREVRLAGGSYATLVGPDGPTQSQGRYVRLSKGERARLTLEFHLPGSIDELVIEPSARYEPLRWNFNGRDYAVETRRTVQLGDSP